MATNGSQPVARWVLLCAHSIGRERNWAAVNEWPQSLRTSVSTCLNSRFPILIWWGPDLVMLYNDAYRGIIGSKHPSALAQPGRACWPEIWHIIGPMLEGVLHRGEATWSNDLLLVLERNGYPEECYFTFSYSPIRDESGGIGGVFTPVAETTEHVVEGRRLRTLQDLGRRTSGARDVTSACKAITQTLSENPWSIPFAAIYLFDERNTNCASLISSFGVPEGSPIAPARVDVGELPGLLADSVRASRMTMLADLGELLGPLPPSIWNVPPRSGVVLPVIMPGQIDPLGFVLAAANPLTEMDTSFQGFFQLIGGHISSAIADARAYQQERERGRALAELDRAKTVFFSNVSHEFRTPLTLMLGPLENLLERAVPSTVVSREELEMVHRNAMRLLRLVNTLLDFTRIEAGRINALYESTDLAAFTAEISSCFQSAMDCAGLKFVIDCPPLSESAWVDHEMWEKIVLNLLSNAFKFTLAGGVVVRLRDIEGGFQLTVDDTGAGIPEAAIPHLFDRFYRVEGVMGRTHEGTGIGLPLVQQLTTLHGGKVSVESVYRGGSTFSVFIPKGYAHLPAAQVGSPMVKSTARTAAANYVEEAIGWLPEENRPAGSRGLLAADTVQAPHAQTATGQILLADDNSDMREYIQRLLCNYYDVRAVSNGLDALSEARRQPPDLILTDVMMPGLDGFELLRELRADETTRAIPVILLSARAGEDARVEGLQAGADDYVVKPFTVRELLARVGAHLSMGALRREVAEKERSLRTEAEAAHQEVATILESISDAFISLDREWRFIYANAEAQRSMDMTREELIGRSFWDVFPDARNTNLEKEYRRAMEDRVVVKFENFYIPWQRWFELRVYPDSEGGLSIFYQEITSRKQAENAIHKANEALRAANADLEQFAHSASHDLREPLRMVRSHCELLQRRYAEKFDSRADEMIAFCVEGTRRMDALLTDLLTYAQASSDHQEQIEAFPLVSALDHSLSNLRAVIEATKAIITHDELPVLRIAPVHAQQLFQNLIGNAVKYRGSEVPRIHISARPDREQWVISVCDNGIGIAGEHVERIFAMFKRLHSTAEYSGSGIGLAICKRIVERYGGRIWVESQPGRGSTFSFSIPSLLT